MTTPEELLEETVAPTEDLRAEMFKILDELSTARADRTAILRAEFDALWKQVASPEAEPTVH